MQQKHAVNTRMLNTATFLVVILLSGWLLVIGRNILIPLILAIIIWYLIDTLSDRLQHLTLGEYKIPPAVALLLSVFIFIFATVATINLVADNAVALAKDAPTYQENIQTKLQSLLQVVAPKTDLNFNKFSDLFSIQKLVAWTTSAISGITSSFMLIAIYLMFLLIEQKTFDKKFSALFSDSEKVEHALKVRNDIALRIRSYLSIKTLVSVMTGVISFALLELIGVNYAIFWGFIIFLLNFIPTIGSLLGVVFPAALSLVQFDTSWQFFFVVIVLGAVQFAIGNILEPRLMGSSLNLSGLVIMLSLAIWGSIWGITGMILCVPITVIMLIICAEFPSTRGIAVLLSSNGKV